MVTGDRQGTMESRVTHFREMIIAQLLAELFHTFGEQHDLCSVYSHGGVGLMIPWIGGMAMYKYVVRHKEIGIDDWNTPRRVTQALRTIVLSMRPGRAFDGGIGLDGQCGLDMKPSQRTEYSWTVLITKYAKCGQGREALRMYEEMRKDGVEPSPRTFVPLLKSCISLQDLESAQQIHAEVVSRGFESDLYVGTMLVDVYAKCRNLLDARCVFEKMPRRDVVCWNAMILGYAQMRKGEEALRLYTRMQHEGVAPNDRTYVSALKACSTLAASDDRGAGMATKKKRCLEIVRAIHADIKNGQFDLDVYVGNMLVDVYGKCGSLQDARQVFEEMPCRDVVSWNSMIFGYVQMGRGGDALQLYTQMRQEYVAPDGRTYVSVLKACISLAESGDRNEGDRSRCLQTVRDINAALRKGKFESDVFVGNMLVDAYAKCGSLEDAQQVFEKMPHRDVVSWNTMILGYVQMDRGEEALQLYTRMQQEHVEPDGRTYVSALKACSTIAEPGERNEGDGRAVKARCLETVRAIHDSIVEAKFQTNLFVETMLVDVYTRCGSLEDAKHVFETMSCRDVVSWTAMIVGYVQMDKGEEALQTYMQMQKDGVTPDERTYVSALKACCILASTDDSNLSDRIPVKKRCLETVRAIHASVRKKKVELDVFVGSMLVDAYAKCESLKDARFVFEMMPRRDVVSWTAMIFGYVQRGEGEVALQLYTRMLQEGVLPSNRTYVAALKACSCLAETKEMNGDDVLPLKAGCLEAIRSIHRDIVLCNFESDVFVGTMLVDVYAKCGSLEDARSVFERIPDRSVVSWNAMILGYVQMDQGADALELFTRMQQEGVTPNNRTYVGALSACASVAGLEKGKEIHAQLLTARLESIDSFLTDSLIHMYSKCGSMLHAHQVFDEVPRKGIVAWNALIAGYAHQGDSELVFYLFHGMLQEGIQPDGVTFLGLLTVCSHVGQVDRGHKYFTAMSSDYGITPTMEHFTCLIDLLGRAGHLDDAMEVLETMPFQPQGALWRCMLGACQKWGDVELGRQAFECAVRLNKDDAAPYVLMSNIYSAAHMWEEEKQIQAMRAKSQAWSGVWT